MLCRVEVGSTAELCFLAHFFSFARNLFFFSKQIVNSGRPLYEKGRGGGGF